MPVNSLISPARALAGDTPRLSLEGTLNRTHERRGPPDQGLPAQVDPGSRSLSRGADAATVFLVALGSDESTGYSGVGKLMAKDTGHRKRRGYVTFDDLKRAARGSPEDAQELLDAIEEHRRQQRDLLAARRARSTSR